MRLLLLNLATDADDPILGFTTIWIQKIATLTTAIDVITMRAGRIDVPNNVSVYSVGKEKGYSELRRFVEFYRILWRLLRQHRYDGCFAHMMPLFAVMAAPLLKTKRIPIVLWYAHKSVTLTLRLATFLANRVVTPSSESFRISSPKVRVIGHGIDTAMFAPLPTNDHTEAMFRIVTVGRLSRIKRLELLIQGVAEFARAHPDIRILFTVVGAPMTAQDHDYYQRLQEQAAAFRLEERICFEGSRPYQQIPLCYQQADCFISMSDTGSIDKATLEAMSCGVIPIMTNHSFATSFDERLAMLCLIQPNPELLAEHLFCVASLHIEERRRIGQQLRELVVREHSLSTLSQKIINEFTF